MGIDERVSRLIGRIYESAYDPKAWDLVIDEVLAQTESCAALVSVSDLRSQQMSRARFYGDDSSGIADATHVYFDESLYLEDRTFRFASRNPDGRFCESTQVIPIETYFDDPVVRYCRETIGASHWLVGYTAPVDELTFGFSILPPAEVGPPTERNKRLFKMLFEHMDRALHLAARPPSLDGEQDALVILDRSGHVQKVSALAQQLIETGDGLFIRHGQLAAATGTDTTRLNGAIAGALNALTEGSFGGAVALPRPSGKRDLLVTTTPLPRSKSAWRAFQPAVLVKIIDAEARASDPASERWTALFGFTPAEARFACALVVADCNVRNAADALGIAYWTARVHLKKVLEKTGCHSQSQLIRILTQTD